MGSKLFDRRLLRPVGKFDSQLFRNLTFRYRWNSALTRCGIDPSTAKILQISERADGLAIAITVKSKTRQAASLCEEAGSQTLSWAIGRRVVFLGSDPYRPTVHSLMVEVGPLVAGDLPHPVPIQWSSDECIVPLGLNGTSGARFDLNLWSRSRGSTHVLVGGTTGGGKSNTVNVLLAGLVAARVSLLGIDCKSGETLNPWSSIFSAPVVDPSLDVDKCDELLAKLVTLMERRQQMPGLNYVPITLVVEEWANLPLKPASIGDNLERIAAQGRSASLGIILTTQRPTSGVGSVRTSTRGNLPIKIAHSTVGDRAASESILGGGLREAADLPTDPPGLALVRVGGSELTHVRVFRCPGPPWQEPPFRRTIDDIEAWEIEVQRAVRSERNQDFGLSHLFEE
jgi:hypothetical protein